MLLYFILCVDMCSPQQNIKWNKYLAREKKRYEKDFTWDKLEWVIEDASDGKAAGDDNIPYEVINALRP